MQGQSHAGMQGQRPAQVQGETLGPSRATALAQLYVDATYNTGYFLVASLVKNPASPPTLKIIFSTKEEKEKWE